MRLQLRTIALPLATDLPYRRVRLSQRRSERCTQMMLQNLQTGSG